MCVTVWIDWDGVVEGGSGVCMCFFRDKYVCMEGEIGVCLFRKWEE